MTVDHTAVGSRVVVRSRLGGRGPGGGPAMTDVVGVLLTYDGTELSVRRRDGSVTRVRVEDVVAARTVPMLPGGREGRGLRIDPEQLQRIADDGWPAPDTERLGEWLLRAAGGFTGRANSVSVHGSPGRPLPLALDAVAAFYRHRGLRPMAQVVLGSDWDRAFDSAGWRTKPGSHHGAVVQVASVRSALRCAGSTERVRLSERVSDDWLALYNRAEELDPSTVRAVLEGPERVVLASVGAPAVAIGRMVLHGDWCGMAAVEVAPRVRRQGLARRVVDALLRAAAHEGARWCYLQTMDSNTAALELYAGYGFLTHHRYRYVVPAVDA
jgi:ribosomal protein S18 acetylase RimI-like enzyme